MRRSLLSIAILALSSWVAASPIEEVRELDADARVSLSNVRGTVKVVAADIGEARIGGDLADDAKLEISGDAQHLTVKVIYPEQSGWFGGATQANGDTRLEVELPATVTLDVAVVSADVELDGLRGSVVEVDSVSGNISTRELRPQRLELASVSGDMTLQGSSPDSRIETVSGELRLRGELSGELRVGSVSGDVELDSSAALSSLDIEVVSGDLRLKHAIAPNARVRVESLSGDVRLHWPTATSADLEIQTFSGDIESSVGEVEREEYGPGAKLQTRLGSGSARVRIETFSGNAELILE
ncbi:MAG: hypothetical protein BWZ07_02357 [Alphaproteobacteria bacterium ADurb.BinA280]|jgi:DUF4097 and DUF4098 domain-containing protein YvlB|nr:DUF4097 family beta strand repeat protein [Xanthomonadales bacterium]OPZ10917.1 MAG: hypothetical protein BWZ07_02357 [Alphaproteobacteria bacterium ADurb.BinA280]